jgi:hypothetical protein
MGKITGYWDSAVGYGEVATAAKKDETLVGDFFIHPIRFNQNLGGLCFGK